MKLNLKDKKLLYWLDQNSRATNKELGKKAGLTQQGVGYKLKKLHEEGIIRKFVTFINTPSLGYSHYKVFIRLQETTEEVEKEIVEYLIKDKNIRWAASLIGGYDLSFSVMAKDALEFSEIFNKIESKFGKYVIEKDILTNVSSPGFTRDYLVKGKTSKKLDYKTSKEIQKIDEVDKKVLKSISQDSRKNVVDIAKEIDETVDVVKYRLKRLKEKKVISGFSIQLNLEKLGYEYYTIFFDLHNISREFEKKVTSFALMHPNVLFIVKTIGSHNFQLEIEVKNYLELEKILKDFRKDFSGHIRDFEILRVVKEYKYDFYPF